MVVGWNKFYRILRTTWVELLVLEPRLGKPIWSPWSVELLVPGAELEKQSGALEGCGLSY